MRDGKDGANIVDTHSVDWLLWKRASPEWSSFQFRETLMHWALRYGNGYAEIEADQLGRPMAMWPLHPERVQVCRAEENIYSSADDEIAQGELYYEVNDGSGAKTVLAAKRMFHIRGFGEGPVGVNVIDYAAQSIGWARAAQLFGASFFGNGMNIAGIVSFKKSLTQDGFKKAKSEFEQVYKGISNSNKTAFIDQDASWTPIGTDPQKAQLIEIHQHLVEEICRWFGVPPHKVMHLLRATFSNIEHQAIEVVVDSVSPWVKRFEDEADYKLFGQQNRQGFYTKMNMRALLRGDSASTAAFIKEMVSIGAYSPNRALELLDENTIGPQGNIHVMQSQNVTLETIANPPKPAPPAPPPAPAPAAIIEDAAASRARARASVMLELV